MGGFRGERVLAIAAIGAAAFYRPLVFWAANAWELSSPIRPLIAGLLVATAALSIYALGLRVTTHALPVSLAISLTILVLYSWRWIPTIAPIFLVACSIFVGLITAFLGDGLRRQVAIVFVAVLGIGPLLNLIVSHVARAEQLPLVELTPREVATPTGDVEDVLVVVVDSYPSFVVARDLFQHDTTVLQERLGTLGYSVAQIAWSQHAFTQYSIPAILELKPIIDVEAPPTWKNKRNLNRIIGGDSLVAETLKLAGFSYVHVESGWNEGSCGDVDVCLSNVWLDEITWSLLEPTVIGGWLAEKRGHWTVSGTLASFDRLMKQESLFDNGHHEFVFAHLILPHSPVLVDESCRLKPLPLRFSDPDGTDATPSAWSDQFDCVDSLISEIASMVGDSTVVLITADHGTKTIRRPDKQATSWSDANIAETYSILLAYKMPDSCEEPRRLLNTVVMASLMKCAVGIHSDANEGDVLIGFNDHLWITPQEIDDIEQRLLAGELQLLREG